MTRRLRCVIVTVVLGASLLSSPPTHAREADLGVSLGVPPIPLFDGLEPGALAMQPGGLPLRLLERDPREGLVHDLVATSSGRLACAMDDLDLRSRVPTRLGRALDTGFLAGRPDLRAVQPLIERDHGVGWLSTALSFLVRVPEGFVLVAAEDGIVSFSERSRGSWRPPSADWTRYLSLEYGGAGTIVARLEDGSVQTFGRVERTPHLWLLRTEDASGNALEYRYRDGLLAALVSSGGGQLSIERPMWGATTQPGTPAERIVGIRDEAGRRVAYSYDNGRLARHVDASSSTWSYEYDGSDLRVVGPGGPTELTVTYDAEGRVGAWTHRGIGRVLTYESGRTHVTLPGGASWTYERDGAGYTRRILGPEGFGSELEWSPETGNLDAVTDALAARHEFDRDDRHRVVRYTGPGPDGERVE